VASFHDSSTQFLRLRGVLILVSCPVDVSRYRSTSQFWKFCESV